MFIEHPDQILEDRKPPSQIVQRGIAGITRIIMFLAPYLPGLIIIGNRQAGGFKLGRIRRLAELGQGRAVETGDEKRFDL